MRILFISLFLASALGFAADHSAPIAPISPVQANNHQRATVDSASKPVDTGILGSDQLTDLKDRKFSLTVVSENFAQEIFRKMAAQKNIPFHYPDDGCYARAHKMALLMDKMGVTCGKVFLEKGDYEDPEGVYFDQQGKQHSSSTLHVDTKYAPKGYVEWWYHVAPIVLVQKDGGNVVYVIDPALFDRAVPVQKWITLQTERNFDHSNPHYYTKRFAYTPNDKFSDLDNYRDEDVQDMSYTMSSYLGIAKLRQSAVKGAHP